MSPPTSWSACIALAMFLEMKHLCGVCIRALSQIRVIFLSLKSRFVACVLLSLQVSRTAI